MHQLASKRVRRGARSAKRAGMAPRPLNRLDQQILSLLGDGPPRSTAAIATALGVDQLTIRVRMNQLVKMRRVVRVGYCQEPQAAGGWQQGRPIRQGVWTVAEQA